MQLIGVVVYRATVKVEAGGIAIEAERDLERRGTVKSAHRPPDHNPEKMTAFTAGVDVPFEPPNQLAIEFPSVDDQLKRLKHPVPYFSAGLRTWCTYGRWTTGLAEDGKTWIAGSPDEARNGGPGSAPSPTAN